MSELRVEWIRAVKEQSLETLKDVTHKDELKALDRRGQNLLFYAIKSNALDVLYYLIHTAGLNVNQRNQYSETPLHIAAHLGNQQALEILLTHHADVRTINDKCQSPLMLAAAKGAKDAVRTLIDHNARIQGHDDLGQHVLFYALRGRKKSIFKALVLEGAYPHEVNIKRQSLMHEVASLGDMRLFHLLREYGVNAMMPDMYHQTPLHLAVIHQHTDMAMQLCELGLSSYAQDRFNETPYRLAERYGNEELLAYFERQKNDPKSKEYKANYPLHEALLKGQTDYVMAHIKTPAATRYDRHGASLLFYALMQENQTVFEGVLQVHGIAKPLHQHLPYDVAEAVIMMRQDAFVERLLAYDPLAFDQLNPKFLVCALNTTKTLLKR